MLKLNEYGLHRVRTKKYLFNDEVPVEVCYYNTGIMHIRFPTFGTGVYRNSLNADTSPVVLYFDKEPVTFNERYLRSVFFDRIDYSKKNEYNEIIIQGTRIFRFFVKTVKSMVLTGELIPVDE